MSETKDGGPAFPTLGDAFMQVANGDWVPKSHYGMQGDPGMSLRDYFAATVLPAAIAWQRALSDERFPVTPESVAQLSYRLSDAMLAEKERKR